MVISTIIKTLDYLHFIEDKESGTSMTTKSQEMFLVIDFGGQYNQLIARRVRECGVYCEIVSYTRSLAEIKAKANLKGIIFTGGTNSAYLPDSPTIDPEIFT